MTTKGKGRKANNGASAAFLYPIRHMPFTPELAAHIRAEQKAVFGRILAATRKKPANLDIGALAFDIGEACMLAPYEIDPQERSKAQKRLKLITRIRKRSDKISALMNGDPFISANAVQPYTELHSRYRISSLEDQLASLAKGWRNKTDVPATLKGRRPSRREWLAGVALPLVYEKHWGSRAGRSQNEDKTTGKQRAGGPCVRFIEATLEALGEHYTASAVSRAMDRLKLVRSQHREARAKLEKN